MIEFYANAIIGKIRSSAARFSVAYNEILCAHAIPQRIRLRQRLFLVLDRAFENRE